jgi:AcrR family transcriptional regulator
MATDATRTRLLDEAERLFLAQGYERVSVRAINAAAGMNPAAVAYHFGSKEGLVVALLQRRLGPLWAEQLAGVHRPGVAETVALVAGPLDELARRRDGRMLLHLLARVALGNRDLPWDQTWFRFKPWCDLLSAARPDLSPGEVLNRWRLAFALLLQVYGEPLADVRALAGPPPLATVTAFVTAGLDAPAPPATQEPP